MTPEPKLTKVLNRTVSIANNGKTYLEVKWGGNIHNKANVGDHVEVDGRRYKVSGEGSRYDTPQGRKIRLYLEPVAGDAPGANTTSGHVASGDPYAHDAHGNYVPSKRITGSAPDDRI